MVVLHGWYAKKAGVQSQGGVSPYRYSYHPSVTFPHVLFRVSVISYASRVLLQLDGKGVGAIFDHEANSLAIYL